MTSLRKMSSAPSRYLYHQGIRHPGISTVAIGERHEGRDQIGNLSKYPQGSSRLCFWQRHDGAWVCYSTTSIFGGPHHGKFMVQTWTLSTDHLRQLVTQEPRFYGTRALARRKAEAFHFGRKR